MLKITFNTKDLHRLKGTLQQLLHITRQQEVQEQIGILLSAQGKRNIREGSADGRQSYRLLRPATLRQKQRQKYSAKPLQRTGLLLRNLSFKTEDNTLYLTALKYAKYHQFGTKKMPARAVFSIRPANKRAILKLINDYIKKRVNGPLV